MRSGGRRKSIAFFIVLGVCLVAGVVALNVGWIILNWREAGLLIAGLIVFPLIITGVVLNTIFLVREIRRRNQREMELAREHAALESARAELLIEQGKLAVVNQELVISTDQDSNGFLVAVRDSGPGIDPTHLDRVFEAFYTTKPRGTGMGLRICQSIIGAHGGRLWADANEPRGAVFQFTLPGAEAEFTNPLRASPRT